MASAYGPVWIEKRLGLTTYAGFGGSPNSPMLLLTTPPLKLASSIIG